MTLRKIGLEEELLLVDPVTRLPAPLADRAVRASDSADVEGELFRQQIETQTRPCTGLDELAEELRRTRAEVCAAAEAAGALAVAVGTPVLGDTEIDITNNQRYLRIREEYGELARSALASALHVHVDVADDEEAVRVVDGIGPWLPALLALSANSPYAWGRDTGHASWRSQVWGRWPSHSTGERFGSVQAYREVTQRIVDWGAALDLGMTYLDARLARDYPTVEIRIADVCTDPGHAVLVAALCRALVTVATAEPVAEWRSELLRAATWRAGRYGVTGRLVHPGTRELAPVREVLEALVAHVRPALEDAGDLDRVRALLDGLLAGGNGAVVQRRVWEETGSFEAIVDDLACRTRAGGQDLG